MANKKKNSQGNKKAAASAPQPQEKGGKTEGGKTEEGFNPPRTPEEQQRARRGMWIAVFSSVGIWLVFWLLIVSLVDITWVR